MKKGKCTVNPRTKKILKSHSPKLLVLLLQSGFVVVDVDTSPLLYSIIRCDII
jgi:hypothetical protein